MLCQQFSHLWATVASVPRCDMLGTPQDGKGLCCQYATSGPLLIPSPALKHWGPPPPQDGRGHVANTPTVRHCGFCPACEALGTPQDGKGYGANLPTCGPLLILSSTLKCVWGGGGDGTGYVANPPTCGPFHIFCATLKRWDPPPKDGRGYVANLPIYAPLLILSRVVKCKGPLRLQGFCRQSAQLQANMEFAPRFEALGTHHVANPPTCGPPLLPSPAMKHWELLKTAGLCSQSYQLWATAYFSTTPKHRGPPRMAEVV